MVTVEMLIAVLKEIVVISDRKHDAWDTAHDLLKKYEATRPPHWLKEPNSSTLTCFLGPWKVGVVYFDKCVARHDTCQWATICLVLTNDLAISKLKMRQSRLLKKR